ncbi:MAG: epoxyqueuosine reductase QueH [Endomicrobia bacterium]|nr:epoxyqueuosine reductase QueH [Endomicrobiia bacterium]
MSTNPSVLLHICCGICAAECINHLKNLGYEITGFFYNPNIHPEEEYLARKKVVKQVAEILNINMIYGEYEPDRWFNECEIYADEPEGGKRCGICYELRLTETYKQAQLLGYNFFSTTLAISPHKSFITITSIGKKIGNNKFLGIDFKKDDGFNKTIAFAKVHNLYRQKYCGCIYSKTFYQKQLRSQTDTR